MTELLASAGFATLEFREPWLLLTALLAPLVYALASRTRGRVNYSSLDLLAGTPRTLKSRLARLPALLLALAVLPLAVALAGPRTADATTRISQDGIAIMLVIDRSGSMDARDFVRDDYSVSRLDAVKQAVQAFVLGAEPGARGRPNDLIGVVVFGTHADAASPLTLDHGNLLTIVEDLDVARGEGESATAIGEGLGLGVERLRALEANVDELDSKVIILLTDGVNNAGEIEPVQAAELAARLGIKVYTIGAGDTGIAPLPMRGRGGRTVLRPMRVEMDAETLKAIAERTGGEYFHAKDADGLLRVYQAIDELERSEITEIRYLQYQELYAPWALAGLALIALATLLGATWLRRLP